MDVMASKCRDLTLFSMHFAGEILGLLALEG